MFKIFVFNSHKIQNCPNTYRFKNTKVHRGVRGFVKNLEILKPTEHVIRKTDQADQFSRPSSIGGY